MLIDESVFDDQMRGLLVARGSYTSEKKKEEIKRFWYLEFRDSDEKAFIETMGKLKFGGGSDSDSKGFPTFRDFRDVYNSVMPVSQRLKGRKFCGYCVSGVVYFRDVHKPSGEVRDFAAYCEPCTTHKRTEDTTKVNPHKLHKDRLGHLRTFEAREMDLVPQEIKWPRFLIERVKGRNKGKAPEKKYFLGLSKDDDAPLEPGANRYGFKVEEPNVQKAQITQSKIESPPVKREQSPSQVEINAALQGPPKAIDDKPMNYIKELI